MAADSQSASRRMMLHAAPSPRHSMRTKAIIAVAALIAIPTALSGYMTNHLALSALEETLLRDSAVLAEATSRMVAGHYNPGHDGGINEAVARLARDERIAFLVISDSSGRVISEHYNEPVAWHAYQRRVPPADRRSAITLNRSIEVERDNGAPLIVRRQLIPQLEAAPRSVAARGTIELGMFDPKLLNMRQDLQDTAILTIAIICLFSLPMVVWWVRGWTNPLRKIVAATRQLGQGRAFHTVHIQRDDEIGELAESFNMMGSNLMRIQEALVDANEQLEHKVAERTAQLQQANRKLEVEMQEKDQFLRAVSHDLGAPLRNISGLVQMLMLKHRAEMSEDALAKLERIAANAKAETELLGDLLELSRIRSQQGRASRVDLDQLVRQLAEALGYEMEHKGITFVVDEPLPTVWAERNRMRQVFQNLIENAMKYMPADASTREIHVGVVQRGEQQRFYVRDTGAGIAAEDHQAIFEVFRRARYSGQQSEGGRGVGLATVKTIIERYGGRIAVESEPPNGATFWFTFGESIMSPPPETQAAEPDRPPASAVATGTVAPA